MQTRRGPIEYLEAGAEVPLLVVRGSGGGTTMAIVLPMRTRRS